jgi:hypothetical protein
MSRQCESAISYLEVSKMYERNSVFPQPANGNLCFSTQSSVMKCRRPPMEIVHQYHHALVNMLRRQCGL